jgi:hypothetical protein
VTRFYADEDGVWREDDGHPRLGLAWAKMSVVVAYRLEPAAGGHVVVEIDSADDRTVVLVDKHAGFAQVIAEMERLLVGFERDRLEHLAPLDADTDPITLWRRAGPPSSAN